MPTFLVRIELHHAHSTDYNMLYEQMEEVQEFYRTVLAISKKRYHLPHGEYRKDMSLLPASGNLSSEEVTLQHVHSLAQKAIDATIAASKKNKKVSYLTASHSTTQLVGSTRLSNLTEVQE